MLSTHPTVAEVLESDQAPNEPGALDWTDDKDLVPVPETVGTKASVRAFRVYRIYRV